MFFQGSNKFLIKKGSHGQVSWVNHGLKALPRAPREVLCPPEGGLSLSRTPKRLYPGTFLFFSLVCWNTQVELLRPLVVASVPKALSECTLSGPSSQMPTEPRRVTRARPGAVENPGDWGPSARLRGQRRHTPRAVWPHSSGFWGFRRCRRSGKQGFCVKSPAF